MESQGVESTIYTGTECYAIMLSKTKTDTILFLWIELYAPSDQRDKFILWTLKFDPSPLDVILGILNYADTHALSVFKVV